MAKTGDDLIEPQNDAERKLIEASRKGTIANFLSRPPADKTVRAALLRILVTEADADRWPLTPAGVRLHGAIVEGRLDLADCTVTKPLWFTRCTIKEGITLADASLALLNLENTEISSGIAASRARVDRGFFMNGAIVKGECNLGGETIEGPFSANNATFDNPGGLAILASGAKASGWFMDGATVEGEFSLHSATIDGHFSAANARFENAKGPAIMAFGAKVSGWFMDHATVRGECSLQDTTIDGPFVASKARFENIKGLAIKASSARASAWFMDGATVDGQCNLHGATIESQFSANGACFLNPGQWALTLQNATVRSGIILRDSAKISGLLSLASSDIGRLDLDTSSITDCPGLALDLRNATIRHDVRATRGFRSEGAVVLDRASIEGVTDFGTATVAATDAAGRSKEAFVADIPPKEVAANSGVAAAAATDTDSEAAKPADAADPVLPRLQEQYRSRAYSTVEAKIGRLVMPDTPPVGIVDLSRAHVGTYEDLKKGWPRLPATGDRRRSDKYRIVGDDKQHLVLDGFTYDHLEYPSGVADSQAGKTHIWEARLDWLNAQHADHLVRHFDPQPWRQLAKVLRSMGYDEDARHIAIEQRIRWRFADGRDVFERAINRLLHLVGDYGFNPWKAVFASFIAIMVFADLYAVMALSCGLADCTDGSVFVPARVGDVLLPVEITTGKEAMVQLADQYPPFSGLFYSIGVFVPVIDLGSDSYWTPNMRYGPLAICSLTLPFTLGNLAFLAVLAERIIGAFLIAVALTGFTGLLTKDE